MFTKDDIKAQLRAMGARSDCPTLMHSSLRLIGEVEGGAAELLNALIEYFTADGGLFCIPTHTWANLGKPVYTLDMTKCESNLGAFAKIALESGLGVRSENPTHSMVVFGEREKALQFICDDEFVLTPTAPESCYGKLYRDNGQILLAGVMQNRNTYLHTVAEILKLENRMDTKAIPVTVKRASGEVIERNITLFNESFIGDASLRFTKYELAFRYRGNTVDGLVGNAPAELCSARGMLETIKLIFERSEGKDPLSDEKPINPKLFS